MLIVATGARLMPEETPGMLGPGWLSDVFTFYSLEGAQALEQKLAKFDAGRLVVNVVDMPIKCPVAPLEFCFLADWFFRQHGKREHVAITYVTPLDGAFTKPIASQRLGALLGTKGIKLVTEFNTGEVDAEHGALVSYHGHANCFIETGFGKALLIDFNYDTEPLPGHFPSAVRLPLLKESSLNHLGKLMFPWFYWHVLLAGRDIPGVQSAMPARGKDRALIGSGTK